MITQDQNGDSTNEPDPLAPPSQDGASNDSTEETSQEGQDSGPTLETVDQASYNEAVRSARRAKLPESVIKGMPYDEMLAWHRDYAPVQADIDYTFQQRKILEDKIARLEEGTATPGNPSDGGEEVDLSALGLDPKQEEAIRALVAAQVSPLQQAQADAQRQAGEQILQRQFDARVSEFPSLKDPRVRFQVQEEAERLVLAYPNDPGRALDLAIKVIAGGGSPTPPQGSGLKNKGKTDGASPGSARERHRALAREIIHGKTQQ